MYVIILLITLILFTILGWRVFGKRFVNRVVKEIENFKKDLK